MAKQSNKLDRVEALLRAHGGAALSPQFTRDVLAAVNRLPAPELLKPARNWRDMLYALRLLSTGERIGLGLTLAGGAALALPSVRDLLALLAWELSDLTLSLNIGETALSASLLSVLAIVLGGMFLAGVGAYASRQHLLGA